MPEPPSYNMPSSGSKLPDEGVVGGGSGAWGLVGVGAMQPLLASGVGWGHGGICQTPILLRSISASFAN